MVRRTRPRHARQNWLAFRAVTAVTIASAMAALVGSFTVALQQISPGAALADTTMSSTLVTDPNAVFSEPNVAKPAYLTPITDPTYNTTLTRIAGNAGTPLSFSNGGSGTWGQDARQHYNDDQAWNADGSLLMLQNSGSPDQLILDGNTYQPKYNKCPNYDVGDDRWLPQLAHKNERMNVNGSTLEWFDVVNCVQTRSWTLPFAADGDVSQNPSADGRFTALYDGTRIFVVDMDPQSPFAPYPNKRIGPVFDLSNCGLADCSVDFAEISPSGQHIIVAYNGDHNRLLDVDPSTLAITPHQFPATAPNCSSVSGHSLSNGYMFDLGHPGAGFDPFDNNDEVMVGQRRSWCPSSVNGVTLGPVVMVNLVDGSVTNLITAGNTASAYHISMVDYGRPGWAYVSFWPSPGARFSDEIIAVKLDGSGSVERLIQTHTDTTNCYRCESHPVPSRDGGRVLFASAWNYDCTTGCGTSSNPQAYVVDARPTGVVPSPTPTTPSPTPTTPTPTPTTPTPTPTTPTPSPTPTTPTPTPTTPSPIPTTPTPTPTSTDPSPAPNLVTDSGFEGTLSGWNNAGRSGTALMFGTPGHTGSDAGKIANVSGKWVPELTLNDSPNWVRTTVAKTYHIAMWIRSDNPGQVLTLQIREYQKSALVGSTQASQPLTTGWQQIVVAYTPKVPGKTTLDVNANLPQASAGVDFYVDDVSITTS